MEGVVRERARIRMVAGSANPMITGSQGESGTAREIIGAAFGVSGATTGRMLNVAKGVARLERKRGVTVPPLFETFLPRAWGLRGRIIRLAQKGTVPSPRRWWVTASQGEPVPPQKRKSRRSLPRVTGTKRREWAWPAGSPMRRRSVDSGRLP